MTGEAVVTTRESHKYRTLVTIAGQAKMAAAALNGTKVNITTAVVGDGGGSYYAPSADLTALKNEVWRGTIANKKINPASANMIDVKVVLDGTVGGWTIREAGLVDDDGDLIVICNLPDTEKAVILDGVASSLTLLLHVVFTNVAAVAFSVDPSVNYATSDELESAIQSHDENPGAHTDLLPSIEFIQIDHGLGCYPQVMVAACPHSAGISGAGNGPAGGADIESFPAKPIYHGRNSLTIKTVKAVVELGSRPTLHRLSATEYAVTFADNPMTSVYIQLLCSLSAGTPSLPTDAVAIKNMVFSTTPPSDTSVLWGEPN